MLLLSTMTDDYDDGNNDNDNDKDGDGNINTCRPTYNNDPIRTNQSYM